jgi:hypothetical protein
MFRLIGSSSGQIQNTVLVYSVSAHIMGSHTVYKIVLTLKIMFNLLQTTGHVMNHQFNIQQLYTLPTLCLCVLYLSENKQRLVPLTA